MIRNITFFHTHNQSIGLSRIATEPYKPPALIERNTKILEPTSVGTDGAWINKEKLQSPDPKATLIYILTTTW